MTAPASAQKNKPRIGALVTEVRTTITLSALLGFTAGALGILPFAAIAEIGRALLTPGHDWTDAWTWAIIAVCAMLIRYLLYTMALSITHIADLQLRGSLREKMVHTIARVPLGWLGERNSGTILKNVTVNTTKMHVLVAHLAGDFMHTLGLVLAGFTYLFTVHWGMALTLLTVWILLVGVGTMLGFNRGGATVEDFFKAAEGITAASIELVDGMNEVKNFGIVEKSFARYEKARELMTRVNLSWLMNSLITMATVMSIVQASATVMIVSAIGFIFWLTGLLASPLQIFSFLLVAIVIPTGLMAIMQIFYSYKQAFEAATEISEVIETPQLPAPTHPLDPNPETAKANNTPAIQFKNVTFGYTKETNVLKNINFTVKTGSTTALVGPSGGGKTTIARLITRFWDVTEGNINVFGADVREVTQTWLLNQVTIVFQEAYLTPDTVHGNIALAKPDATREQIVQAAKNARIHERITRMPHGYDTQIGEEGGMLSGGEKQRIAIARAFLTDSPIVVLDEATAQTDPRSEAEIREALNILAKGKTIIVIAHRLATVQNADQILVIENGEIAAGGTHKQLVTQNGIYTKLLTAQGLLPNTKTGDTTAQTETATTRQETNK